MNTEFIEAHLYGGPPRPKLDIWISNGIYILLTEHEVRTGEYCSSSLFTCLWTEPFFGFSDDKSKGVPYRVWRFEVDSAVQGELHAEEVIAEQIRKSLQGEAKNKIVAFGPSTSVDQILTQLDQFYGEDGAALDDELLSQAYAMRQLDGEEVSAFASHLDNKVRQAKDHCAELLPDEEAVDRHLRLLFWQSVKGTVKDKARHKKDACKTFAELIVAARYGEKESTPSQHPRREARQNN